MYITVGSVCTNVGSAIAVVAGYGWSLTLSALLSSSPAASDAAMNLDLVIIDSVFNKRTIRTLYNDRLN